MVTFEPHPTTRHLQLEVHFRLAEAPDLLRLEWYGQYSHLRSMIHRAYQDQLAGKVWMLLAEVNGFPVGQLYIQTKGRNQRLTDGKTRAYLYAFRVMEMFQGQGIGSQLVGWAESRLQQRDYRWATIAVSKTNHGALRLYERLGYQRFAEDPGRWSYTDHEGIEHHVEDPCWLLEKHLKMR